MKHIKIAPKLEKTFLFVIKLFMIILLFCAFFSLFYKQIPQLKTINRTSIISFGIFIIAVCGSIRIYGGFPVGKKNVSDIINSVVL